MKIVLKGRKISKGVAEGQALVSSKPVSFLGGVNPDTGVVVERGHDLEGVCIGGRVLVFPRGKGSTGGSWIILRLAENNVAPKAMINIETEPIVAVGAIISKIPLIDKLDRNPIEAIKTGDFVKVDANVGSVEIIKLGGGGCARAIS